jgi:hypothetical protein
VPTCPFCSSELTLADRRHFEDMDGISNGMIVRRFVCPAGGTRYEHQFVGGLPPVVPHSEHWYLERDDGSQICLRARPYTEPEQERARCAECAHPTSERLCLGDHRGVAGDRATLAERPSLTKVQSTEAVVIEDVAVDVEVTHHRCDVHGDDGQPHRVIRREIGQ